MSKKVYLHIVASEDLLPPVADHNHILQKDPKFWGYRCILDNCAYKVALATLERRLAHE